MPCCSVARTALGCGSHAAGRAGRGARWAPRGSITGPRAGDADRLGFPPLGGASRGDARSCLSAGWTSRQRRWRQSSSVALVETQQLRMLERLRHAGEQPVTLGELRAGGIDFPAVVLSELEINGYVIERLHEHGRLIGVRLLENDAPPMRPQGWRQRWRRPCDSPTSRRLAGVLAPRPAGSSRARRCRLPSRRGTSHATRAGTYATRSSVPSRSMPSKGARRAR